MDLRVGNIYILEVMGIVTSDIRYHSSWIGSQLQKKEKNFGSI